MWRAQCSDEHVGTGHARCHWRIGCDVFWKITGLSLVKGDKNVVNVFDGWLQTKAGHVHTRKNDDGDRCGSHDCRSNLPFEVGN